MKMMLSVMTLLIFFAGMPTVQSVEKAGDITYDWLVKRGDEYGYLDYIPHVKKLFKIKKVRTFLEFGVGYQTKYFLDECRKVISVDFMTPSYGPFSSPDGMMNCIKLFNEYSNWIPLAYFSAYQGDVNWAPFKYIASEHFYRANEYQSKTQQNYSRVDGFYQFELKDFLSNILRFHKVDVALINPRMYLRGDLITILLGKVPIIVAHDTVCRAQGTKEDIYGYSRIETPSNYEEIFLSHGGGTTIWVIKSDEYKELAQELKDYAKGL